MSSARQERRVDLPSDGRSARRARNRAAVLEAVHDLFTEERAVPTLESIANRSGVSLRSIHRYFPDSQDLMVEALMHRVGSTDRLFHLEGVGEGTLEQRIERVVDQRLRIYESSAPTIRVSLSVVDTMPLIGAQVQRRKEQLADQARATFAAELEGAAPEEAERVLTCVELLCQFESLDALHEEQGRSIEEMRALLAAGIRALITSAKRPERP